MKLAAWRIGKDKTQEWVADQLGVSQPHVSKMEQARNPAVPGAKVIIKAYIMSDGEITPNDWFDLPKLPRERAEEAARRRLEPCLPGIDQAQAA